MPTGRQITEIRQPPHKTNYKQKLAFDRNFNQKVHLGKRTETWKIVKFIIIKLNNTVGY